MSTEEDGDPMAKISFSWKNMTVTVDPGWRNKKIPKTILDNGTLFRLR